MELSPEGEALVEGLSKDKQEEEDAWQEYAKVLELGESSSSTEHGEDPLQEIYRMRRQEAAEILNDQKVIQDKKTESLRRINALRSENFWKRKKRRW